MYVVGMWCLPSSNHGNTLSYRQTMGICVEILFYGLVAPNYQYAWLPAHIKSRDAELMLFKCWASVADGGPT